VRWRYNLVQLGLAVLTLASCAGLLSTILWGALLGQPDMHIVGNGSTASELNRIRRPYLGSDAAGRRAVSATLGLPGVHPAVGALAQLHPAALAALGVERLGSRRNLARAYRERNA
jgi:hypothetical protein